MRERQGTDVEFVRWYVVGRGLLGLDLGLQTRGGGRARGLQECTVRACWLLRDRTYTFCVFGLPIVHAHCSVHTMVTHTQPTTLKETHARAHALTSRRFILLIDKQVERWWQMIKSIQGSQRRG